jgi:hypothetical protein
MLLIVEPLRQGAEHQVFNAVLIETARAAFPDEPIEFRADPDHLAAVQAALPPGLGVHFRPLDVPGRRASVLGRARADMALVGELMALEGRGDLRLLFSSVTVPMLWAFARAERPRRPVPVVLHGGLADIQWVPRFNLPRRMLSLRRAMSMAPPWLRFLVLDRAIVDVMNDIDPALAARLEAFPHPVPSNYEPRSSLPGADPLAVGLLGLATPQKGLLPFVELAEAFRGRPDVRFELVGRLHADLPEDVSRRARALGTAPDGRLPREEFIRRVGALTFAAFFFDLEHYGLTASGVLLDCIAMGIPLVGYRHPALLALQREAGDIGHFCDPGQERRLIEDVAAAFDPARYRAQCEAMLRVRAARRPDGQRDLVQSFFTF